MDWTLYVITDRRWGRSHLEVARAAIEGGATAIQLRDKRLSDRQLLARAGRRPGNADLVAVLGTEQDTSGTSLTLATGTLTKSVYAINGNTSLPAPPPIAPGDLVTYRITHELPATDFDSLVLADYLPLPVLDATTLNQFDATASATPPTS